jgi:hypothetical protein
MKLLQACFYATVLMTSLNATAQNPDSSGNHTTQDSLGRPMFNMYGDLLNDDPAYNPRYPWWQTGIRIITTNVASWAMNRYIFKVDWTSSGINDWKNAFKKGPEWDVDGFGINFIGHPHSGSYYHNIARSNGYSYWQTLPFTIAGSLTWEYFGENTRPSYNDMINTPISGMFLGEIFYRVSSNILDDRSRGRERVLREIIAGIISPTRALNRLTQGKMFRITSKEVYQKEPINITVNAAAHRINNGTDFGSGGTNANVNFQLDYGNPFEIRHRKPFDIFRLRAEGSIGTSKKLLENINGYGILFGNNYKKGRLLFGAFQHFDYWNNTVFEVAALGFGAGVIARIPVAKHSNIFSTIHLGIVPMAGNNSRYGPDTSSFRHYNYGGGFQAKAEETFNLNKWATIGFTGFYYWIHTYDGLPGNSLVGILKPYITIKIYKSLSIGFEHFIYQNDRFLAGNENLHLTTTEQKLFLQLFLEDRERTGKYH